MNFICASSTTHKTPRPQITRSWANHWIKSLLSLGQKIARNPWYCRLKNKNVAQLKKHVLHIIISINNHQKSGDSIMNRKIIKKQTHHFDHNYSLAIRLARRRFLLSFIRSYSCARSRFILLYKCHKIICHMGRNFIASSTKQSRCFLHICFIIVCDTAHPP